MGVPSPPPATPNSSTSGMSNSMVRPTLLVVEPEPEQALSARKLVLESGKFNVITAHSGREFFEMLRRFPLVDCAIIHGEIDDVSCHEMCAAVKKTNSRIA